MKNGGLVVFPTTGLYGLGADAMNRHAVERIYRIKKRDFDKPILVLVKDKSTLMRLSREVPESASKMMAAFWPGKLTIILQARPVLPDILTGGTGKIGLRIPRHPVASALVRTFNGPVTGTSANLSGARCRAVEGRGRIDRCRCYSRSTCAFEGRRDFKREPFAGITNSLTIRTNLNM